MADENNCDKAGKVPVTTEAPAQSPPDAPPPAPPVESAMPATPTATALAPIQEPPVVPVQAKPRRRPSTRVSADPAVQHGLRKEGRLFRVRATPGGEPSLVEAADQAEAVAVYADEYEIEGDAATAIKAYKLPA
jgi:hypothetical protein